MEHLTVIYSDNSDVDIRLIQGVYSKLFENFRFSKRSLNPDVIVYPMHVGSSIDDCVCLLLSKPHKDLLPLFSSFEDEDGNHVWLTYSTNLAVAEHVVTFLNKKGFYDSKENGIEVVPHIANLLEIKEGSFLDGLFLRLNNLVSGDANFETFICFLLENILDCQSGERMPLAKQLTALYIHEFYVAFTTRDLHKEINANHEVREYMGDRVSWSTMTAYFLARFQNLNAKHLTFLHQDYCSKQIQASISRSLFFHEYVRSKGRITVDVYENLFEAFVGTLDEISFREGIRGLRSFPRLDVAFLTKIYDSFHLVAQDSKPPFTELNENMLAILGSANGLWSRSLKKTKNSIFVNLSGKHRSSLANVIADKSKVNELFELMTRGRRYNELNMVREQHTFYREVNHALLLCVPPAKILEFKNLEHVDQRQLDQLNGLIQSSFRVHLANVEKNWSDTYWWLEVFNDDGQVAYTCSTQDLDNPDNFDSLISLLKDEISETIDNELVDILQPLRPNEDFVRYRGKEYSLNIKASVPVVKRFLAENHLDIHMVLFGETVIYQDVYHLKFTDVFHRFRMSIPEVSDIKTYVSTLAEMMDCQLVDACYPEEVLAFIGNRLLMTFGNRILHSRNPSAGESQLTNMQTFYFSKVVKRELCQLLKSPVGFDVLLGMLGKECSARLINIVFLNVVLEDENCFQFGKEVNSICWHIENQGKQMDKSKSPKVYFSYGKDSCSFAFGDLKANISPRWKNYAIVRSLLERKAYEAIMRAYNAFEVSNLMNYRFQSLSGYAKFALLMKQRGLCDFKIGLVDSKRFSIRVGHGRLFVFDSLEDAYFELEKARC